MRIFEFSWAQDRVKHNGGMGGQGIPPPKNVPSDLSELTDEHFFCSQPTASVKQSVTIIESLTHVKPQGYCSVSTRHPANGPFLPSREPRRQPSSRTPPQNCFLRSSDCAQTRKSCRTFSESLPGGESGGRGKRCRARALGSSIMAKNI